MPQRLFLDFESDTKGNYYLAGSEVDGNFNQVILDLRLSGLATYRNLEIMNIRDFLEDICEKNDELIIYGYSVHEKDVFNKIVENPSLKKKNLKYTNLLKAAKSWVFNCRQQEFDDLPPFRKNASAFQAKTQRNSLASVMRLTDFQCPTDYAPGRTTKRFNMGIKGLERHDQDYKKLTKSQKRDLTQALSHNEFDVRALPILLNCITAEHPKALVRATKDLFD